MTAQTATQAMSENRLILGDAAEPLLQVIRSELAHAAEARAVLDRIAMTRLDGETSEPLEDDKQTEGDKPSCEIQPPEPWPRK